MPSFDAVIASIQAAFGESATFHRGVLAPVTINAVYREPLQEGFTGNSTVITQVSVFEVAVADLADAAVGDILVRANGDRFVVQAPPTKDEAGLVWTLDVVPANAP